MESLSIVTPQYGIDCIVKNCTTLESFFFFESGDLDVDKLLDAGSLIDKFSSRNPKIFDESCDRLTQEARDRGCLGRSPVVIW